ncbi:MAG TPA: XdhC family protein [Polyangiales bacterium]|nr:XdhC family protein [Polyangiales bacterium]
MSELATLLRHADALRARGEPFVVATVMRVRGSAYRRPGARMLTTEHEWRAGSISGGCLEGDVIARGFFRTRRERAVLMSYDARADRGDPDGGGYGLGCDGIVDVLIERIDRQTRCDPLAFIARCRREQKRGVIATVFESETKTEVGARLLYLEGEIETTLERDVQRVAQLAREVLAAGERSERTLDGRLFLFEVIEPPPQLFIVGTGFDAMPVAVLAGSLDWGVTICERHRSIGTQARFARIASHLAGSADALAVEIERALRPLVVLMSHRYLFDRELLGALIPTRVSYIGLLGPARRTERMLGELRDKGVAIDDSTRERLHGPVGLDLGAETPGEIALSVIAELQAHLARTRASPLRRRRGAIHRTDHTDQRPTHINLVAGVSAKG